MHSPPNTGYREKKKQIDIYHTTLTNLCLAQVHRRLAFLHNLKYTGTMEADLMLHKM
jgi:hypothetical protein